MDDWVLCESRWKMRMAVKLMHQTLFSLGLHTHPDKTFIGRVVKGFDFLGVQFSPADPESTEQPSKEAPPEAFTITPSAVSQKRLSEKLEQHFHHAAQLYEQGRLLSLRGIEQYLSHWLRWSKGIGIASLNALDIVQQVLRDLRRNAPM